MVYFKITDGKVTRKFKVTTGEMTYDQLKERIASLFPEALEEGCKDLHLKYRDTDGDVITISTDQEFQEALAELPTDHVWMLHIHGAHPKPKPQQRQTVPAGFFFRPSHSLGLFANPWHGMGRQGFFNHPLMSNPWGANPWGSFDREFDRMVGEHTRLLNALHNAPEDEPMATGGAEATDAAEGSGEGGTVAKGAESGQVAPKGNYQVKHFGSWEPRAFEGPCGKGRIIGPVGYFMSWGSGPEKEEQKEEEGEKKEEGENKEEEGEKTAEEAASAGAEGMDQWRKNSSKRTLDSQNK